jgi:hypothetical protein
VTALRNLTGRRFNRLLVLSHAANKGGRTHWLCRCDCGAEKTVDGGSLVSGNTKSCGCLTVEAAKQRLTTHGRTGSPEHWSWFAMRVRCNNPKSIQFHNYGGRGIRVCERWLNSFENFLADMGRRPPDTTLHRINNDGNYEPGNCIWATRKEHELNKSYGNAKPVVVEHVRYETIAAAARAYNIKPNRLYDRMQDHSETARRAIFALRKKHPQARPPISITIRGKTFSSLNAARKAYSISSHTSLSRYLRQGKTGDQALAAWRKNASKRRTRS